MVTHVAMPYPQVIELFRRLAVSGFVVLIPYEFIYWRIILALMVALPICLVTAIVQPFRRPEDNFLSLANQSMLILAFILCGLIRIVNDDGLTDEQKTDLIGYSSNIGLFFALCALIMGFCVLLICVYGYKSARIRMSGPTDYAYFTFRTHVHSLSRPALTWLTHSITHPL